MVTLRDVVLIKVRSMGPCSFQSILLDARDQHAKFLKNYQVAKVLNELIKDGYITLYDDGASFSPTNKAIEHLRIMAEVKKVLGESLPG